MRQVSRYVGGFITAGGKIDVCGELPADRCANGHANRLQCETSRYVRRRAARNEMSRRNKASDLGDRSHRCRPTLSAETSRTGPGTHDRNRVIRCRLPLRDDLSIASGLDETQYHLSPNFAPIPETVHIPSTTPLRWMGSRLRSSVDIAPANASPIVRAP
jgi:hypothetical protein